jgi:hypothetical protein
MPYSEYCAFLASSLGDHFLAFPVSNDVSLAKYSKPPYWTLVQYEKRVSFRYELEADAVGFLRAGQSVYRCPSGGQ